MPARPWTDYVLWTESYDDLFLHHGRRLGIQPWMLKAIAAWESRLIAGAFRFKRSELRFYGRYIEGKTEWRAHRYYDHPEIIAASYGLMQIMFPTALWMARRGPGANPFGEGEREPDFWLVFDPAINVDLGARYYRYQLDRYEGDQRLALCAYNAGSVRRNSAGEVFNASYAANVMQAAEITTHSGPWA